MLLCSAQTTGGSEYLAQTLRTALQLSLATCYRCYRLPCSSTLRVKPVLTCMLLCIIAKRLMQEPLLVGTCPSACHDLPVNYELKNTFDLLHGMQMQNFLLHFSMLLCDRSLRHSLHIDIVCRDLHMCRAVLTLSSNEHIPQHLCRFD